MSRRVRHRQIYKPSAVGGTVNTTVCGRVSNAEDDLNVSADEAVTRKFRLRIVEKDGDVRLGWIGWKPTE